MITKPGILTIEEEGALDPLHITPTLTCEPEGNVLVLAVHGRLGHRAWIRLTQKQAHALAFQVKVMADRLPQIREKLLEPIKQALMGPTLNQAEADHLIAFIKTRVRE